MKNEFECALVTEKELLDDLLLTKYLLLINAPEEYHIDPPTSEWHDGQRRLSS